MINVKDPDIPGIPDERMFFFGFELKDFCNKNQRDFAWILFLKNLYW